MEELAAAAAAARADEEPPELDVDPADMERNAVYSDYEEGPEEVDDEADAAHPGGEDGDVQPEAQDERPEEEEVAEAVDEAEGGAAAAPSTPNSVAALKVEELKLHLKWRGLPLDGLKAALAERLQKALDDNVPVLDVLPDARRGRPPATAGASGVTAGSSAAAREPAVEWEPLDASEIDRPVWTGPPGKFEPDPALGLTSATHPFDYMCKFYEPKDREEQVQNSIRYQGYLKQEFAEKMPYKRAGDMTMARNSLAHSMLLLQVASRRVGADGCKVVAARLCQTR
jgi:hypothetical protein